MDETDIQQVIISPDKKVIRIRMNVARICISYQQNVNRNFNFLFILQNLQTYSSSFFR
jgi:hypothetical protein